MFRKFLLSAGLISSLFLAASSEAELISQGYNLPSAFNPFVGCNANTVIGNNTASTAVPVCTGTVSVGIVRTGAATIFHAAGGNTSNVQFNTTTANSGVALNGWRANVNGAPAILANRSMSGATGVAGIVTTGAVGYTMLSDFDDGASTGGDIFDVTSFVDQVVARGTISTGIIPVERYWWLMNAAGTLKEADCWDSDGSLWVATTGTVIVPAAPCNTGKEVIRAIDGTVFDQTFSQTVPTTGQTVTIADTSDEALIKPAGTLAALTIVLPTCSALYNGKMARFSSSQIITTLTTNATAGTVGTSFASLVAGIGHGYRCRGTDTTWYALY